MDTEQLVAEITTRLRGPEFVGWRTPDLDRFSRALRPRMRTLTPDQRRDLALALYRSGRIEETHVATCVLSDCISELGAEQADYLDQLAGLLTEWGTTDGFCIDLMQPFLGNHPEQALDLVRRWNVSGQIWKRRASVVTFTRTAGEC